MSHKVLYGRPWRNCSAQRDSSPLYSPSLEFWLAVVHVWVDPADLAAARSGLMVAHAVAIRVGRSSLKLPNTAASDAAEPCLDLHDDDAMMSTACGAR